MRPTTDHRGPTHVDEELQRHHHEDEQADAPPQGGVIDECEKAGIMRMAAVDSRVGSRLAKIVTLMTAIPPTAVFA